MCTRTRVRTLPLVWHSTNGTSRYQWYHGTNGTTGTIQMVHTVYIHIYKHYLKNDLKYKYHWYTCTYLSACISIAIVVFEMMLYTCTYVRTADIAVESEPQLYQVVYRDVFHADNAH